MKLNNGFADCPSCFQGERLSILQTFSSFGLELLSLVCSACLWVDEEKDSRIQQPYRQSCLDAELRPGLFKWFSVFRKRAAADGARRRRSMYEHHSLCLSVAGRSTNRIIDGRAA